MGVGEDLRAIPLRLLWVQVMSELMGLDIFQSTSRYTYMVTRVEELLYKGRSRYQDIVVARLTDFGLALILDGLIQSTEYDEYFYHESLVHPAMVTHPNPRSVLIIGGGEGATLREVLRYRTVESAVMVDIDGKVIEIAKKFLKPMHQGSFDDPRARVTIMDGRLFLEKSSDTYDVIVLDLTDPYGPEISKRLYTEDFYRLVHQHLSDDGIMVTQAGNSYFYGDVYDWVLQNVKKVFGIVAEYNVWVPSFSYTCNFIIGSRRYDPRVLSAEEVDKRLRERGVSGLRFYSGRAHVALMNTPIFRKVLKGF